MGGWGWAQIPMNNSDGGHSANLISILKTKNIFDDDFDCQYLDIEEIFAETHVIASFHY